MKKNYIFLLAVVLLLFGVNNRTINAQEKRLNSSPKTFQTFFAKFKAAAEKNDKTGVASMTRFPFTYGFDAGDEGKMSKAQFIKRFGEIFGVNPGEFLTEKNPVFSTNARNEYVISTEEASHFVFIKQKNGFKFSAYIVEP